MDTDNNNFPHRALTHKIIGLSFDIFKQLGRGYPEKIYQRAFEKKLKDNEIPYEKEKYCKIKIDGERIGSFKLDFLIQKEIIVELKVRNTFYNKDIAQVLTYLKTNNLKVGLILLFTKDNVKIKRLIN